MFTKLGINTIRVYTIDNSQNHDACMNALAAAGIYVILDTDTPLYSLNREDPAPSYNSLYLQSVFATIDEFAGYSNTLAFLSGNEVINNASNTNCAPYVKAVTRDMKQYIGDRSYRAIPVGYSAADVDANQQLMAEYLNCGTDDQRADFYSINDYSWCDPSSFTISGWDTLVANYSSYGLPLFMSEYGCITNNRTFQEVATLYSTQMTGVFSGGLVYEYSEEGNGFGLVTISGTTATPNSDFTALVAAFSGTPNPTGLGGAKTSSPASTCPPESAQWDVANDDLPAIPSAAVTFDKNGAGTAPGLNGPGSQDAGDSENESSGTASAGSGTASVTATGASSTSTSKSKSDASMMKGMDGGVMYVVGMGMLGAMALL